MEIYQDPIIKKYIDLIKSVVGNDFFKGIYYGDPIRIPNSNLPALIISKDETRVSNSLEGGDSATDAHFIALTLTVVTDIRDELNDDKSIAPGIARLYDIIEGREASTLQLKTKSLLHILRNNIFVDTALGLRTDLGTITRVDYGLTVGKREQEAWAVEAQVEFIAHFTQLR
jgi:hypothetical protein